MGDLLATIAFNLIVIHLTYQPALVTNVTNGRRNMRSSELRKSNETALQKRLRHRSVVCHLVADLMAHCGEDDECARAIGRRVMSGIGWAYTGVNEDRPGNALQQRLITCQMVGYLVSNAAGHEDALEIGRLFVRGIDWAWGEANQRDLRLVC
jgi:hypothetical protein